MFYRLEKKASEVGCKPLVRLRVKVDLRPSPDGIFSDLVLSSHLYQAASSSSPEGGRYVQVPLYYTFNSAASPTSTSTTIITC